MIGKEILESIMAWVVEGLGPAHAVMDKIVLSLLIIALLSLCRFLIDRAVRRRTDDPQSRYRWRAAVRIIVIITGLLLLGNVWIEGVEALATFIGLVAAALVFVLKEPISNLAGWFFLVSWHPFRMGDRIQIGDVYGDVVDIRLFQTVLIEICTWVDADQSTGRIVHVPNGRVFVDPVRNYTQGFAYIWNELPVRLTFDSDWKRAKEILLRIADEHGSAVVESAREDLAEASKEFLIQFRKLTPIVYTSVKEFGVLLTVRYLCRSRARRSTEEQLWEKILEAFAEEPSIRFAYPTTRFVGAPDALWQDGGEGHERPSSIEAPAGER